MTKVHQGLLDIFTSGWPVLDLSCAAFGKYVSLHFIDILSIHPSVLYYYHRSNINTIWYHLYNLTKPMTSFLRLILQPYLQLTQLYSDVCYVPEHKISTTTFQISIAMKKLVKEDFIIGEFNSTTFKNLMKFWCYFWNLFTNDYQSEQLF